jgi:hypothetical protein
MTYSKIHQAFSEHLKTPDVLKNPEKYLGPNYQDVLNFWIYVDTLSDEEKKKMYDRFLALDEDVWDSAWCAAMDAANEVVCLEFRHNAWWAAYDVTGKRVVFGNATLELIGSHKLLEKNKNLTFLPLTIKKTTPLKKFLNLIKRIFQF